MRSSTDHVGFCHDQLEDYKVQLTLSDVRVGESTATLAASWRDPEYGCEIVCMREPWAVRPTVRKGTLTRPPLCIFYSVDRSRWKRDRLPPTGSFAELSIATQHPAWDDWRNPGPLPIQRFVEWFKEREDFENQERVARKDFKWADTALEAVRSAVGAVLGAEYGAPRIERSGGVRLVIVKSGRPLWNARPRSSVRGIITWARRANKDSGWISESTGNLTRSMLQRYDRGAFSLNA